MKRFAYTFLICFLALCSHGATAQVYKKDLVIPLNPENSASGTENLDGPHGKIIAEILERMDGQISYFKTKTPHAYKGFYRQYYGCITPDSKKYYRPDAKYIETLPLHQTSWLLVQHKDDSPISNSQKLIGKKVGLLFSPEYHYSFLPHSGVDYEVQGDLRGNLKKLATNRLDVVVISDAAAHLNLFSEPEFQDLRYDISPTLAKIDDAILCHDSIRGKKIVEIFNNVIRELNLQK